MTDKLPAVLPSSAIAPANSGDTLYMVPALIADLGDPAAWRYVEFFAANIRNPNKHAPRLRLLHEKGGKQHIMPCHHSLTEALRAYIDAAGIAEDRKGWLFRTSPRHNATALTEQPMAQADAWRMIRRRAAAAGIMAPIGNHSFRATGITAYLGNGGVLEHAQSMAAHESPRTTKLYDRTEERLTQDEVERIRLK